MLKRGRPYINRHKTAGIIVVERGRKDSTPLDTHLGPNGGTAYSGILELGGCDEGKVEDLLYELFLRGLSARTVNRIRRRDLCITCQKLSFWEKLRKTLVERKSENDKW